MQGEVGGCALLPSLLRGGVGITAALPVLIPSSITQRQKGHGSPACISCGLGAVDDESRFARGHALEERARAVDLRNGLNNVEPMVRGRALSDLVELLQDSTHVGACLWRAQRTYV